MISDTPSFKISSTSERLPLWQPKQHLIIKIVLIIRDIYALHCTCGSYVRTMYLRNPISIRATTVLIISEYNQNKLTSGLIIVNPTCTNRQTTLSPQTSSQLPNSLLPKISTQLATLSYCTLSPVHLC